MISIWKIDRPSGDVLHVGRMSARTVAVPLRVEHGHYGGRLGGVVGGHFQAPLQRSERFIHVRRQRSRGQPVWPVRSVWSQASCSRHQNSDQHSDGKRRQPSHCSL